MNFFGVISLIVLITRVRYLLAQQTNSDPKLDSKLISPDIKINDEFREVKGWINGIQNIFKPPNEELAQQLITFKPQIPHGPVSTPPTKSPELHDDFINEYPPKEDRPSRPIIGNLISKPNNWGEANQLTMEVEPPLWSLSDSNIISNSGREPNTIQEWMNENRPASLLQKPPRATENNPVNPLNQLPWTKEPKPIATSTINQIKEGTSRPPPLKPNFQPAPWEKPLDNLKPSSRPSSTKPIDSDNDFWENAKTDRPVRQTTPFLKQKSTTRRPYEGPYDGWDDPILTDKPRNPQMDPQNIYQPGQYPIWESPQRPGPMPAPGPYPNPNPNPIIARPDPVPNYKPQPVSAVKPAPPIKPAPPQESPPQDWVNPNLPGWWNEKPAPTLQPLPEPVDDANGWGGNIFGDNTGNGIGGMGDINGIGGILVGNGSGNGEGGLGSLNGLGGNILAHNSANGVGGVGNENGLGGFIIGDGSGNGKGGVGSNNGIGGNKAKGNSANGTGGVGNNNGKGGIIIGSNSGNGVGGVNQNVAPNNNPNNNHKPLNRFIHRFLYKLL